MRLGGSCWVGGDGVDGCLAAWIESFGDCCWFWVYIIFGKTMVFEKQEMFPGSRLGVRVEDVSQLRMVNVLFHDEEVVKSSLPVFAFHIQILASQYVIPRDSQMSIILNKAAPITS